VREWIAYPLATILCGLSNVAGLGAGIVKIYSLMLILNYNMASSTNYTFPFMLGSALINWIILVPRKHPTINKIPLINFDIAMLLVPFLLIGTNIGVIFNTILPMMATSIAMMLL
jgi:hypothetical protein